MKIGIDASQIVYGTGVSVYTQKLIENLAKIDHKNQYTIFATSLRAKKKLNEFAQSQKEHKNFEFKIASLPPYLMEFLWNKLHIYPIEKFIGEVDIFHSSDWVEPPVAQKNTKKITTVHDMVPSLFPASVHPRILKNQNRKLKHVQKESDLILVDSQTTKDDLIKFLKIDESKIKVIYLAPSEDFKPQDEDKIKAVLEKYNIKKPYILSVATQEPRKNIQKVLDVFEKIVKNNPQIRLVLTGKYGWGSGFHAPQNVVWTDYVPKEDLAPLYAGCRVFVYPSLYEGFGLPILEAMACGAPVITSNNSSMAEIAKGAAILVDPRSESQLQKAIEVVFSLNMENYQQMVRASLTRAREYTWTKTARETLKAYEDLYKSSQSEISDEESLEEETQSEAKEKNKES